VTVDITLTLNGQEIPQLSTVKLKEPYEPLKELFALAQECRTKETGRGEEVLEVAGAKLKTTRVTYTVQLSAAGQTLKGTATVWTAPGIPLGGTVKIEADLGPSGKKMRELVAYGSKPAKAK
jgi:hypothetical protein